MDRLYIRSYFVVAAVGMFCLLSASVVLAQTATDLNCSNCVGPGEVANNTVTWTTIDQKQRNWFISTHGRVGDLEEQLDGVEITVDCAAGDTVTAALASVAVTTPVTITIQGICTEGVAVFRDDVILRGSTPADGITAAGGGFAVFVFGVTVSLQSLTLSGGSAPFGLGCLAGSVVFASDITVVAGTVAGVVATEGAVCQLTDSTINGSLFGMMINTNSQATLRSSVIQDSTFAAVIVEASGSLVLDAVIFPVGTASILRRNGTGGTVSLNSSIHLGNAIIEDNGTGLEILPGGALLVGFNDTVIIRNNVGDGLTFSPNTSAIFSSSDFTISGNGGFGVNCDAVDNGPARGTVSITGGPSTNTGNTSGALSGNCDGVP